MKNLTIHTDKVQQEMRRQGLTYEALGKLHTPAIRRQAAWSVVHNAQTLRSISWLGSVLGIDPRDLIVEKGEDERS